MPTNLTKQDIHEILAYHALDDKQKAHIEKVREAAEVFMVAVQENCPESADKSTAYRKIREALHVANASISLNGMT